MMVGSASLQLRKVRGESTVPVNRGETDDEMVSHSKAV